MARHHDNGSQTNTFLAVPATRKRFKRQPEMERNTLAGTGSLAYTSAPTLPTSSSSDVQPTTVFLGIPTTSKQFRRQSTVARNIPCELTGYATTSPDAHVSPPKQEAAENSCTRCSKWL